MTGTDRENPLRGAAAAKDLADHLAERQRPRPTPSAPDAVERITEIVLAVADRHGTDDGGSVWVCDCGFTSPQIETPEGWDSSEHTAHIALFVRPALSAAGLLPPPAGDALIRDHEWEYDAAANAGYLRFRDGMVTKTREAGNAVNVDYGEDGGLMGVEVLFDAPAAWTVDRLRAEVARHVAYIGECHAHIERRSAEIDRLRAKVRAVEALCRINGGGRVYLDLADVLAALGTISGDSETGAAAGGDRP